MKRFLPLIAALALTACAGNTTLYSVSADVQGSADGLYIAAEKAGEVAVANKALSATQFRAANVTAHTALVALRAARTAGTTSSVTASLAAFNAALADLQTLVGVTPTSATN